MKILLIGHQSFGNRGCEAIVRSTAALVRRRHPEARFLVPSAQAQADAAQWPEHADWGVRFIPAPTVPALLLHWGRLSRLLPFVPALPWPRPALDEAHRDALQTCDLVLSVGGDNLTLDYGLPSLAFHVGLAEAAMQRGVPVVLWGASVGPFSGWPAVQATMTDHLKRLRAITVRESITLTALRALIGSSSKPRLLPTRDPAFTLQAQPVDLQAHWPATDRPVLGLNLSPLAPSETVLAAADFACGVIKRGHAVVLIPHVSALDARGHAVQPILRQQDDVHRLEEVLTRVRQRQGPKAGITRLPAWNAAQLKHAISRCHSFVGARTHSVIAALSSGVPALALSYSHKARGIHRDLLGHEAGVLPMRDMDADMLMQAWELLLGRHGAEREQLLARIPMWQAQAAAAVEVL